MDKTIDNVNYTYWLEQIVVGNSSSTKLLLEVTISTKIGWLELYFFSFFQSSTK